MTVTTAGPAADAGALTLLGRLLPAGTAVVEAFDDALPAPLFPQELAALGNAVAKRRAEFMTARRCAREALGRLGIGPVAIPSGPRREPLWPDGIVGTITHCAGYRAAAIARAGQLTTIGIDAEPHEPLPDGVLDSITLAEERRHLRQLAAQRPGVHWDRLLFSIKESVFKAWYPLTGRWLDFTEATVTISAQRETFHAWLLVPGPVVGGVEVGGFGGRWLVGRGLVLTGIAVPARQPAYAA
ncbi:4'-phosphopantetheinyl transferase [Dactylosporangium siamense]|uniref:4'-phosphopantetheinyl transferase n=1 Tax=Dactylosporangium siamense TaxID=685454 RepID=A0A919PVL6_9ACTN|nr:4'-phosphopantetheinyl transferase superfamily protein [Dactylosporangium siamense]GIG51645.1 4'-phosphopantetheinyl transferase [Dactylosporangium siamense]